MAHVHLGLVEDYLVKCWLVDFLERVGFVGGDLRRFFDVCVVK